MSKTIIECEKCNHKFTKDYFRCESCGSNKRGDGFWLAMVLMGVTVVILNLSRLCSVYQPNFSALLQYIPSKNLLANFSPRWFVYIPIIEVLAGIVVVFRQYRKVFKCQDCGKNTVPGLANCPNCEHLNHDLAKNTRLSFFLLMLISLFSHFRIFYRFFAKKIISNIVILCVQFTLFLLAIFFRNPLFLAVLLMTILFTLGLLLIDFYRLRKNIFKNGDGKRIVG